MPEGEDIIIKGGSVEIEYDNATYREDPKNPRKHRNDGKKITRVVITGDINYDSGDYPDGLRCTITTTCR